MYCQIDCKEQFQWNNIWNSKVFIQENAVENIVCQTAAILHGLNVLTHYPWEKWLSMYDSIQRVFWNW